MKCEQCKKACDPLLSKHNPRASEWYCGACHKSTYMTTDEIMQHGLDPQSRG